MLDNFACFRAHEADHSIFHDRTPKTYGKLLFSRFIRIIETMDVTAQDSCDMRDRLLRYFATCCQEKPLSGSLKRG